MHLSNWKTSPHYEIYNEGSKKETQNWGFLDKQEMWYKNTFDKSTTQLNVFILLCKSAFSVYSLQPMYTFLGNEQVENL